MRQRPYKFMWNSFRSIRLWSAVLRFVYIFWYFIVDGIVHVHCARGRETRSSRRWIGTCFCLCACSKRKIPMKMLPLRLIHKWSNQVPLPDRIVSICRATTPNYAASRSIRQVPRWRQFDFVRVNMWMHSKWLCNLCTCALIALSCNTRQSQLILAISKCHSHTSLRTR